MAIDWGTDDAEELEALRARFGAEPARLRTETPWTSYKQDALR